MNYFKLDGGKVRDYGASTSANTAKTLTIPAKDGLRALINKVVVSTSGAAVGASGCVIDIKEGTAATTLATLSIPAAAAIGSMLNVDFIGGLRAKSIGTKLDVVVGAAGTGASTASTVLGDYSAN